MKFVAETGRPLPMGSNVTPDGVNFSLFSRHATQVSLVLFNPGQLKPDAILPLDPKVHKTGDIWHVFLRGLDGFLHYCFQVEGPSCPQSNHIVNSKGLLLDPYARAVSGNERWGTDWHIHEGQVLRSVIVDDCFDWEGDRPLNIAMKDTIIYELHLRGFTNHPSSAVQYPGTYRGIIEKIPYFKELGVTALEFLPVTEFDEMESTFSDPKSGKKLKNFWGYSPIAFFAPKASYAVDGWNGNQVIEFKEMVKELHKAGLEVILDIVFNHTAEGGVKGPVFNFKGLDNSIYYMLDKTNGKYKNYSGCGNTFNCNHPLVRKFIIDCLRYWVVEMHVDGFRFDLAAILGRDQNGEVLSNPPVVEMIAEDPLLAQTKIIAEAWDAAGLYQVGSFSSHKRWAEWNGRFRDDVRAFMCRRKNSIAPLATRIAGSSDLYQHSSRRPFNSVNFITSHDGFTLYDLVSYNQKHNRANGENNRDGDNNNISWNSGAEGPSQSAKVRNLRERRVKTFAVILFLSQGTPMMVAGDEFCRTQKGNNNAYCQDNDIGWIDWRLKKKNKSMFRFFNLLIQLRKNHAIFRREDFFTAEDHSLTKEIIWQSNQKGVEDWSGDCTTLAFYLSGECGSTKRDNAFFVMLNGGLDVCEFEVPSPPAEQRWFQLINSAAESPSDIFEEADAILMQEARQQVVGMSAVVLIARKG